MTQKSENIEPSAQKKSSKPERKRKPAKLRVWEKDYIDYKLWDSQRWAWEFLRRNADFIGDCKAIKGRNSSKQEQAIAEKYGLSFFKHYSEIVGPFPEFINKIIDSWENTEGQESKVEINLKHGQMLILFNVNQTLETSFELRAQIKSATEALEKYRDGLLVSLEKAPCADEPPPKRRSSSPMHYLRHLKVIDSRNKDAPVPWAKLAKLVFYEKIQVDEKIKGRKLTNIEITQKYYKTLVASLEKPKDYRSIAINTLKVGLGRRILENKSHKKRLNAKLERVQNLKVAKAASENEDAD